MEQSFTATAMAMEHGEVKTAILDRIRSYWLLVSTTELEFGRGKNHHNLCMTLLQVFCKRTDPDPG